MRYAIIRAAQQHTADTVPGTGMAVITDAGMRWDPPPKPNARWANGSPCWRGILSNGEDVMCQAPTLTSAQIAPGLLCLQFTHTGAGLSLGRTTPYGEELAPECLYGIQILQGNRRIDAADLAVRVEGDRVWLSGPELQVVSTRVLVAQGDWYQVNLYNSAGLPARPAIADAVPKATP